MAAMAAAFPLVRSRRHYRTEGWRLRERPCRTVLAAFACMCFAVIGGKPQVALVGGLAPRTSPWNSRSWTQALRAIPAGSDPHTEAWRIFENNPAETLAVLDLPLDLDIVHNKLAIKKAYRALVMKEHPDIDNKSSAVEASARLQRGTAARDLLLNEPYASRIAQAIRSELEAPPYEGVRRASLYGRYFSEEHQRHYYVNMDTGEALWDEPPEDADLILHDRD